MATALDCLAALRHRTALNGNGFGWQGFGLLSYGKVTL